MSDVINKSKDKIAVLVGARDGEVADLNKQINCLTGQLVTAQDALTYLRETQRQEDVVVNEFMINYAKIKSTIRETVKPECVKPAPTCVPNQAPVLSVCCKAPVALYFPTATTNWWICSSCHTAIQKDGSAMPEFKLTKVQVDEYIAKSSNYYDSPKDKFVMDMQSDLIEGQGKTLGEAKAVLIECSGILKLLARNLPQGQFEIISETLTKIKKVTDAIYK